MTIKTITVINHHRQSHHLKDSPKDNHRMLQERE